MEVQKAFFFKNIGIFCKVNVTKCRKIHDFLFYILVISEKFTTFAKIYKSEIGCKGNKKNNTNQINSKKMKTIHEFMCITKTQNNETFYNFQAINLDDKYPYRIMVLSKRYEKGRIKISTHNMMYYENENEMINEFNYHLHLCEKNIFTDTLKIIK